MSAHKDCRGLSGLPHFADLPDDTRTALQNFCQLRTYRAGQTIFDAGGTPPYIGCVLNGFLRMQKTLYDGRQHIVGLLVEGDMFGRAFDGGPVQFAVEAATDAEVCAFQSASFEDLLVRSSELERLVMLNFLNELDRARDWIVITSGKRVTARLAGFLLMICTRFAKVDHLLQVRAHALEVKIPISRIDLAHLLGTSTESISRAFHALAGNGWINIQRPDVIEVFDLEALCREVGDEGTTSYTSVKALIENWERTKD